MSTTNTSPSTPTLFPHKMDVLQLEPTPMTTQQHTATSTPTRHSISAQCCLPSVSTMHLCPVPPTPSGGPQLLRTGYCMPRLADRLEVAIPQRLVTPLTLCATTSPTRDGDSTTLSTQRHSTASCASKPAANPFSTALGTSLRRQRPRQIVSIQCVRAAAFLGWEAHTVTCRWTAVVEGH